MNGMKDGNGKGNKESKRHTSNPYPLYKSRDFGVVASRQTG